MSERRLSPSPRSRGEVESSKARPGEGAIQEQAHHPDTPPHPDGFRRLDLSPQAGRGGRVLPIRVYYEDTDFSGLVYHASYLRFLERGRTEFLRSVGVDQSALHSGEQPLVFAVRRMTIDWLKPARMDDIVEVETRTQAIRGASLDVRQTIRRGADVLVTAAVLVAAIAGGRPARIPDALRTILDGTRLERHE